MKNERLIVSVVLFQRTYGTEGFERGLDCQGGSTPLEFPMHSREGPIPRICTVWTGTHQKHCISPLPITRGISVPFDAYNYWIMGCFVGTPSPSNISISFLIPPFRFTFLINWYKLGRWFPIFHIMTPKAADTPSPSSALQHFAGF